MKILSKDDLGCIIYGATILGSGGGGHPKILEDYISYLFAQHEVVQMIDVNELNGDELIVPIAFVGAPLISMERLPNFACFEVIYQQLKKDHPNKKIVLMPAEIGGCNALTPFILALKYQLPILDADLIGRAFPKIHMCKPAALQSPISRTYLADHHGHLIQFDLTHRDYIEPLVRSCVSQMGFSAIIATFIFQSKDVNQYAIAGSMSRCLSLAHERCFGSLLMQGYIDNVFHQMKNGFLIGEFSIKNHSQSMLVQFQNEFLVLLKQGKAFAGSPDIIVIIDKKSQLPLTTESIQYGLEVELYLLESPDFWKQEVFQKLVHFQHLVLEDL